MTCFIVDDYSYLPKIMVQNVWIHFSPHSNIYSEGRGPFVVSMACVFDTTALFLTLNSYQLAKTSRHRHTAPAHWAATQRTQKVLFQIENVHSGWGYVALRFVESAISRTSSCWTLKVLGHPASCDSVETTNYTVVREQRTCYSHYYSPYHYQQQL